MDNPEKPIDPAVLRIQRRLRRLMLISGLTLGVGIVAVFIAILYRINNDDASRVLAQAARAQNQVSEQALTLSEMGLPADARLISTALNGNRLVLTYAHSAGNTLVFLDANLLTMTGKLELTGQ